MMWNYRKSGEYLENIKSKESEAPNTVNRQQTKSINLVQNCQRTSLDQLNSHENHYSGIIFLDINFERSPDFDAIIDRLTTKVSKSGISREREETVNQHLKSVKKFQLSFLKNQFLFNTLRACCVGDNSCKLFLDKVGQIIALEELSVYISCNTAAGSSNLLGVELKNNLCLTPDEALDLRYLAQEKIVESCARIKSLMFDSGIETNCWLPVLESEERIITAKKVLGQNITAYSSAAAMYLAETQAMLHINDQSEMLALSNMGWLEKKCSLLHLRARILERKILFAFYSEEPKQVEALELLLNILKEKIEELNAELKKQQSLIAQYNMLKGTEFDSILQEYIKTMRKLKEQTWALNKIRRN